MHKMDPVQTGSIRTHAFIAHAATRRCHLGSRTIKPIKEMSLISRGVPGLVHHGAFLAGAGDVQGALRHLYETCLITPLWDTHPNFYRDSWFNWCWLGPETHPAIRRSPLNGLGGARRSIWRQQIFNCVYKHKNLHVYPSDHMFVIFPISH